jgi:voltage-gated hydrogen channel 1
MGFWVGVSILRDSFQESLIKWYSYFRSWFHCFDAFVVVSSFVVDVLLHGILEEAASLVVILRLWRVFKIIEELSVGSKEQTEDLEHMVEELKNDNELLRKEIDRLKKTTSQTAVQNE